MTALLLSAAAALALVLVMEVVMVIEDEGVRTPAQGRRREG